MGTNSRQPHVEQPITADAQLAAAVPDLAVLGGGYFLRGAGWHVRHGEAHLVANAGVQHGVVRWYGPKTRWLWVSKKPPLSVVYVDTPVRRARSDARRIRGLE